MTISEKLEYIHAEKLKNSELFALAGFLNTNELSTFSRNLSNMVIYPEYIGDRIDERWGGTVIKYTDSGIIRTKILPTDHTLSSFDIFDRPDEITYIKTNTDTSAINRPLSYPALTSVNFQSIRQLDGEALSNLFKDNVNLTSIQMDNVSSEYGECFAANCHSLREVQISSMKSLGNDSFCNDALLTSIVVNDLTVISGDNTFNGCKQLREFNAPNLMSAMSNNMFNECNQLTSISMSSVTDAALSTAFGLCWKLKSLDLRNLSNVAKCDGFHGMFMNCYELTDLHIENINRLQMGDLSTNGDYPDPSQSGRIFALTSLTVPNIEEFGSKVTAGCFALRTIDFSARDNAKPIPRCELDSFTKLGNNVKISCFIPSGQTDRWLSESNWRQLSSNGTIVLIEK